MSGGTATHMQGGVRPYGERPTAEAIAAAPGGSTPPPTPAPSGAGAVRPGDLTPLNAPTQRPGEPVTAGLPKQGQMNPLGPDPDFILRALYSVYPHPDLLRLMGQ